MRRSLLLSLLLLMGCTATRVQQPEALPAFHGFAQADDGWSVALFRVPPAAGSTPRGAPVLLVHGVAENRHVFMLEGSDLASFLAAEGFDVWIAELRGDRTSRPPDERTWRRGEWDIDGLAERDVPAILAHVRAATGQEQVLWVGHSLGGVLGYIAAQSEARDRLRGLIAIAAPASFTHPTDLARRVAGLRGLAPKHGQFAMRPLAAMSRGSLRLGPDSNLFHLAFNAANFGVDAASTFADVGTENIGTGVLDQLGLWVERGRLVSADGTRDWTAGLADVTTPTLFVAGSVDHIAPPWSLRTAYDGLGSSDKTWLTMGRGWGQREEYGHTDLLVGDWAYEEVFPALRDWLVARASGE